MGFSSAASYLCPSRTLCTIFLSLSLYFSHTQCSGTRKARNNNDERKKNNRPGKKGSVGPRHTAVLAHELALQSCIHARAAVARCPSPALQSATDFVPLTPLQRAPAALAPASSISLARATPLARVRGPSGGETAKLMCRAPAPTPPARTTPRPIARRSDDATRATWAVTRALIGQRANSTVGGAPCHTPGGRVPLRLLCSLLCLASAR